MGENPILSTNPPVAQLVERFHKNEIIFMKKVGRSSRLRETNIYPSQNIVMGFLFLN